MKKVKSWKERLYIVIFGTHTFAGKIFNTILLGSILISTISVMLETVETLNAKYHWLFVALEWTFTVLFTVEYVMRIVVSKKPLKYIFSFSGLIDFIAIIPTYMGFFFREAHYLLVVRSIRLLRVFRILKLARYTNAARHLSRTLKASRVKIIVFVEVVIIIVAIVGTLMYFIETEEHGFTSIPKSIYWAVVTLTTVGYGDIAPQTTLGQTLATFIMILGYSIIAVPTGIITAEAVKSDANKQILACQNCCFDQHDNDAQFCKKCGSEIKKNIEKT